MITAATGPDRADESGPEGDDVLLARAANGDRAAFGQLYDRHVRPVYWQSYGVLRDDREAEDVTQDVFVTTWNKIRTITLVDESVLPWLLVTARYTALNARRSRQRRRSDELDGTLPADVERRAVTVEPPSA